MTDSTAPVWLHSRDLARRFQTTPKLLRQLIEDDGFAVLPRTERTWLITSDDLDAWEEQRLESSRKAALQRRRLTNYVVNGPTSSRRRKERFTRR